MYQKFNPEIVRPDIILYPNIVYSNPFSDFMQDTIPLTVNILRPFYKMKEWEKLPLFVYIGGGAFRGSTPLRNIPELIYFAERGYVVASIGYRVSSEGTFPAQLQDAKAAIRFLRVHCDEYGIDPECIVAGGHSAGGYLSVMLAATEGVEMFETKEWAGVSDAVQGAVCMSGGGCFLNDVENPAKREIDPLELLIGGKYENHREMLYAATAVNYLSRKTAPIMMIQGELDDVTPLEQAREFYRQMEQAGVDADFYEIPGAGHGTVELRQPDIHRIMLKFFDRVTKR